MRQSFEDALEEIGSRRSLLGPRFVGLMRTVGATVGVGAAVSGVGVGLAHLESRSPLVRHIDVPVAPRPGLKDFRILHITDLHMFNRQQFLVDFLHRVAAEEDFDMVVSTGDNLGGADGYPLLVDALEPLFQKPGAFVLGSNDYYSPSHTPWVSYLDPNHHESALSRHPGTPDLPWLDMVRLMTEAGWLDLSNQSTAIEVPISRTSGADEGSAGAEGDAEPSPETLVAMVGVDDPHIHRDRIPPLTQQWMDPSALRLALTHSPYRRVLDEFTRDHADLILAGHTHGGQVRLPGVGALVTNCDIPRSYSRGLALWQAGSEGSWLHVSAGLGTSRTAPVRLFCRPEVSILRVHPAAVATL